MPQMLPYSNPIQGLVWAMFGWLLPKLETIHSATGTIYSQEHGVYQGITVTNVYLLSHPLSTVLIPIRIALCGASDGNHCHKSVFALSSLYAKPSEFSLSIIVDLSRGKHFDGLFGDLTRFGYLPSLVRLQKLEISKRVYC
jgi:hypothetical protein